MDYSLKSRYWKSLWGKTFYDGEKKAIHPLWAHMIDVASVSRTLLEAGVGRFFKSFLADDVEDKQSANYLSFLAALHDIGKATPQFQLKEQLTKEKLARLGYSFSKLPEYKSHAMDSGIILMNWDEERNGFTDISKFAKYLAMHHGTVFTNNRFDDNINNIGDRKWQDTQFAIIDELKNQFHIRDLSFYKVKNPAMYLIFSGFVTFCDWIASDKDFFLQADSELNISEYRNKSLDIAKSYLRKKGLSDASNLKDKAFLDYFKDKNFKEPNNLQAEIQKTPNFSEPSLTIIEAPTGDGKTEAAFYLAAKQQASQYNRGIYTAMPTMATSNAIHTRLEEFLDNAHDKRKSPANLMLSHSLSFLSELMKKLIENFNKSRDYVNKNEDLSAYAAEWFLPSKRSLTAPYGVGTVDQSFLSVLNVKHFFLRLFGLAGKTIIFDEVHAYDSYMSELLAHLLKWLKAMKSNVIILSATLPKSMKKSLTAAWDCQNTDSVEENRYPLITSISKNQIAYKNYESERYREIIIKLTEREDERIINSLIEDAKEGRDAAYIVNSVKRCQEIYSKIKELKNERNYDFDLKIFHSRYTFGDRERIEKDVLERFGKSGERNKGAIIVATQVIEQSLDLDFDVMYTDIAPIDLLIQRAGRLQRHKRERPSGLKGAVLNIITPKTDENGLPEPNELSAVYEKIIIFRTYFLLKEYDKWILPKDYRELVEGVYDFDKNELYNKLELNDEAIELIKKSLNSFLNLKKSSRNIKTENGIYLPKDMEFLFEDEDKPMPEENHKHPYNVMKTRLGEPSISFVLIERKGDGVFLKREQELVDINKANIEDFLYNGVSLQADYFRNSLDSISPSYWEEYRKEHKHFRNYFAIEMEDGLYESEKYIFNYGNVIGLTINKR